MSKWHTPIRFHANKTLAWCATGKKENNLPVFELKEPTNKDKILSFPMRGNAKGCIQNMANPKEN